MKTLKDAKIASNMPLALEVLIFRLILDIGEKRSIQSLLSSVITCQPVMVDMKALVKLGIWADSVMNVVMILSMRNNTSERVNTDVHNAQEQLKT